MLLNCKSKNEFKGIKRMQSSPCHKYLWELPTPIQDYWSRKTILLLTVICYHHPDGRFPEREKVTISAGNPGMCPGWEGVPPGRKKCVGLSSKEASSAFCPGPTRRTCILGRQPSQLNSKGTGSLVWLKHT